MGWIIAPYADSAVLTIEQEYNKLYTVEYLGNVVGGRPVLYCNVPMAELKKYAALTILKGEVR